MQQAIYRRSWLILGLLGWLGLWLGLAQRPIKAQGVITPTASYTNPLSLTTVGRGAIESCADPVVFRGQTTGDNYWYLFCTKDPFNDQDRNSNNEYIFHNLPMLRSLDLINWSYVGDAFDTLPAWIAPNAGLFAPEVVFANNQYYLYYAVTDVADAVSGEPNCTSDKAIGVATSPNPTGPWVDLGRPVIEPRRGGPDCNFLWVLDPEVIEGENSQRYIYYGSYYGGIQVRQLSADGFTTDPASAVQITIPNRYEAPEVIKRNGYYYLFVSAANCCNGPITGYSVFVGRSTLPTGPFVDREDVSLLAGRVGGTPVLSMNGNRWVGPGHNAVFADAIGQYWTIYHAVDRNEPFFAPGPGFSGVGGEGFLNKRPALLDPIAWVNEWPQVRGGFWASDTPQPAPAAQPGEPNRYRPTVITPDEPGQPIAALSDEFDAPPLSQQWGWVREPVTTTYGLTSGTFRFKTQNADIYVDNNTASVLSEPAPSGDYLVETKFDFDVTPEGCTTGCMFVQAGLVIYSSDDNFIKLSHVAIFETRQTEFAKEVSTVPAGYPRYGNTLVGPPDRTTWLRIVKRDVGSEEHYTAYTSRDGEHWIRGGTWTHNLGANAQIGLVSMGGLSYTANFDYVRVYSVESPRIRFPLLLKS